MHRRWRPTALAFVAARALVAALALAAPAAAEITLAPAYGDSSLLGPDAAIGAIVWNHGHAAHADTPAAPPAFVASLRAAGWDVFTLARPWADDHGTAGEAALAAEARALRAEGYRRILAMGQSWGGWIALDAARVPGLFDGVLAASPAGYGTREENPERYKLNIRVVGLAQAMAPIPVMIFLFAHDDNDPGGRGPALARAFAAKDMPYAVIDRPPGFAGHAAAYGTAFARAFAPCIVGFFARPQGAGAHGCAPAAPASAELLAALLALKGGPPPAALRGASPLLGYWYGWYPDGGREMLLAVDRIARSGRVRGRYAWGPAFDGGSGGKADFLGALKGPGSLAFALGGSRQEYRLRPDGRLDARWVSGDGGTVLTTVVRRLE